MGQENETAYTKKKKVKLEKDEIDQEKKTLRQKKKKVQQ